MKTALRVISGIGIFLGILSVSNSFSGYGQGSFNALVGGIIWIIWGILCLVYLSNE
jgi:hypothetical protein